jgi:phosphoserine aminotransferase
MRAFNFSAGPATLPLEVLEQVREELLDWQQSGASVMELSHRGTEFMRVAAEAEADLRELLAIPNNYKVLFVQGGATAQFSLVPMNLSAPSSTVDYIDTGHWSRKALTEAKRYAKVHLAGDAAGDYSRVPPQSELKFSEAASYAHYTPNETIGGVEFGYVPATGGAPLIADMSSSILSRPIDIPKFGLIYAGAQKNIGPAGMTVLIVREDLLGHARCGTPSVFDYGSIAAEASLLNTPPTFAWYVAALVFKWLKKNGGLTAMAERNRLKAQKLYAAIDGSQIYRNRVAADSRSWMNVPFTLSNPAWDERFLQQAAHRGLKNLKGHRAVGGIRVSLYNAMPMAGVEALVEFMREFERGLGLK